MRGSTTNPLRPSGPLLLGVAILAAGAGVMRPGATSAAARPTHAAHAVTATARKGAASPLAGHWEADVQGDGRAFTFVFDFTVRGDSLGGSLGLSDRENRIRVAGTAKGNKLHFEQFGRWDGTLEGANLKLSRGLDGGKVQHMTAHRAAGK